MTMSGYWTSCFRSSMATTWSPQLIDCSGILVRSRNKSPTDVPQPWPWANRLSNGVAEFPETAVPRRDTAASRVATAVYETHMRNWTSTTSTPGGYCGNRVTQAVFPGGAMAAGGIAVTAVTGAEPHARGAALPPMAYCSRVHTLFWFL